MNNYNHIKYICNCDAFACSFYTSGVLVPGGFGSSGVEGKIAAVEWARTKSTPFLGISLGLQCAVIEFARHVLNYKDANSVEFDKVEHQAVSINYIINNF